MIVFIVMLYVHLNTPDKYYVIFNVNKVVLHFNTISVIFLNWYKIPAYNC